MTNSLARLRSRDLCVNCDVGTHLLNRNLGLAIVRMSVAAAIAFAARLRFLELSFLVFITMPCVAGTQTDAASSEQVHALRVEARSYEHGEGVVRDAGRAAALYCQAARLGDAEAQFSLGWMYANGRGVTRADDLASFFFSLAAAQGHEHARRMLQFVGTDVPQPPECFRPIKGEPNSAAQNLSDEKEETVTAELILETAAQKKVLELVQRLAPEYGVSTRLAMAVIRAESNFDASARSPKNAQGLMQLIPETALRFNVTMPFDPVQNVRGGLAYLRWLLAYFRGDVALAAAAYNAGEGAVNRYRGMPPYAETRAYVRRILQLFGKTEHPYDSRVTSPSPALYTLEQRARF
jgi:TPR repeat protein